MNAGFPLSQFLWYVWQVFQNFPFHLVNRIRELYITGIMITWVSADSLIYHGTSCDKILSRYFWSTSFWSRTVAGEVRAEGRKESRKYILPTPLRSCVWSSACTWRGVPGLRVVSLQFDSQTCAGTWSYLLRSSVTWQAQKETKEPRLIYSWLTDLCKHSPTATVLVSTAFLVLFSICSYYRVKLWKNAWPMNDKRTTWITRKGWTPYRLISIRTGWLCDVEKHIVPYRIMICQRQFACKVSKCVSFYVGQNCH